MKAPTQIAFDARPGDLPDDYPISNLTIMKWGGEGNIFWSNGAPMSAPPTDPAEYDAVAAQIAPFSHAFLDIEHWPYSQIWVPGATDEEMYQAWRDLREVWGQVKSRAPGTKLGYFGQVGCPASTWTVDLEFTRQYDESWQKVWGDPRTCLALQVDMFPQVFYWAGQPIAEMERRLKNEVAILKGYLDKPVYPFIWHRHQADFDGGDNTDASLVPMPTWEAIIDMCLEYADGFTFWQHPFETITPAAQLRLDAIQTAANSL